MQTLKKQSYLNQMREFRHELLVAYEGQYASVKVNAFFIHRFSGVLSFHFPTRANKFSLNITRLVASFVNSTMQIAQWKFSCRHCFNDKICFRNTLHNMNFQSTVSIKRISLIRYNYNRYGLIKLLYPWLSSVAMFHSSSLKQLNINYFIFVNSKATTQSYLKSNGMLREGIRDVLIGKTTEAE